MSAHGQKALRVFSMVYFLDGDRVSWQCECVYVKGCFYHGSQEIQKINYEGDKGQDVSFKGTLPNKLLSSNNVIILQIHQVLNHK